MFKKKYEYHISYHWCKGNENGFGSTTAEKIGKIKCSKDIKSIKKVIENNEGFDNVVIINYILF